MNCPQCGSSDYAADVECKTCGFSGDDPASRIPSQRPMDSSKRDVMNGVGLGCSVLCFVWFFVETLVFVLASKDRVFWSNYGPLVSVGVPVIVGVLLYLAVGNKSSFSKGIGYSLLITIVLAALFAFIGTHFHDTKPSPIASHNGFE